MKPGKLYNIKLASKSVSGSLSHIKHRIDVNTLEKRRHELHLKRNWPLRSWFLTNLLPLILTSETGPRRVHHH